MIKSILKSTLQSMGLTVYKTRSISVGNDPFIDIKNHFGNIELSTFFDVGANTGQTVSRIKAEKPTSTIYAFEPIKDTFDKLYAATKHFAKVHLENIGFGAEVGTLTIGIAKNSLWNSFKNLPNVENTISNETVTVETIDNYLSKNDVKRINFLKIDVEGFEIPVLIGAKNTLSSDKIDFIYCEVGINKNDKHHTPFIEVIHLLTEYNFKFVAFYDHSLINTDAHYANALFFNANILTYQ
ncbi:FkbM family methyltransferase [Cryomorpha ignava]|uniref:FkbM family methyltransferase n=1 Tax=Cryomorpha ignava TaxID=101383 RepID=A0A7K3WPJ8_9FLAO|nr:FkbM family methyltransferase [Cryomorpha ignava]NEN23424.1 FkbM family methyltransferase [Cryomorpha ignava]